MNERIALSLKQTEIENRHCKQCNKRNHIVNPSEKSKYCLEQCEIGKKIKEIGNKMLGITNKRKAEKVVEKPMALSVKNCAKLKYLVRNYPFLKQKDMAKILGVATSQISISIRSGHYQTANPDQSIYEHAESYIKKHYPEKAEGEVKVTKINDQQILKTKAEHVPVEKYEAMKNSWKRLAEEKDKKIQELEQLLKTASELPKVIQADTELQNLLKTKTEQYEKLLSVYQQLVEDQQIHKEQYAALSNQYQTVAVAYENSQKEIVTLENGIEKLKNEQTQKIVNLHF